MVSAAAAATSGHRARRRPAEAPSGWSTCGSPHATDVPPWMLSRADDAGGGASPAASGMPEGPAGGAPDVPSTFDALELATRELAALELAAGCIGTVPARFGEIDGSLLDRAAGAARTGFEPVVVEG